MDVFVMKVDNDYAYVNATEQNIRRAISVDEMALIKNFNESSTSTDDIKSPGGISPKNAVALDPYFNDALQRETSSYGISKRAMLSLAEPADLRKLAADITSTAGVNYNFEQGVGGVVKNIINLADDKEKNVPNIDIHAKIKPSDIIDAKQAVTVMDSEIFNPSALPPIDAPAACELRVREFPCAEDFMSGGQSAISRMKETMSGKQIAGIIMPYKNGYNANEEKYHGQVFFSAKGQMYCERRFGYKQEKGPLFCGAFMKDPKLMQGIIEGIASGNINNLTMFKQDNSTDRSEKRFDPTPNSVPENAGNGKCSPCDPGSGDLYVIMGNGGVWEAMCFSGSFRKYMINNRSVYISDEYALVPTNVIGIQKVSKIHDPVYVAALGEVKNIYLVPEMSFFISTQYMKRIDESSVLGTIEEKEVGKTEIEPIAKSASMTKISSIIKDNNIRFHIDGTPMDSVCALTGMEKNAELAPVDSVDALRLMGTTRERANEILKTAAVKGEVTVYGLRGDFVKNPYEAIEKKAHRAEIMKQIANQIKVCLVKEASLLSDPESVDVVLSLNFINDKNMADYIENLPHMKKTLSKMCSMLVASRMGLTAIDEAATRSAVDGLQKVVDGLESLKLSIGK
jgi:hypothetical protein